MTSTGKGRYYGVQHLSGLRGKVGLPDIAPASRKIANDTFWGGYAPTPTQIPYGWLTPPARFRSDQPRNLAQITRTGGATARAASATSIAAVGERPFTATLNTAVVADPQAFATWIVGNYSSPRRRMPQLRLNLLGRTPTELWRILGREIGDRISITGTPVPTFVLGSDTFGRDVVGDWGSAESGQPYIVTGGSASDYNVANGVGTHNLTSVGVFRSAFLDVGTSDRTLTVDVSLPVANASSGNITQWICGRVLDNANYYVARLTLGTGGGVSLDLLKRVGGSLSGALASSGTIGAGHAANDWWRVKMATFGSSIQAKAWLPPAAEPADWMASATDTEIPAGTLVALLSRLEAGNTNAPLVVSWDNVDVSTPNPTAWPDGVTELVIEGITHTVSGDERYVVWNTAPLIGATPGAAGPWFRADESRTDIGDPLAF